MWPARNRFWLAVNATIATHWEAMRRPNQLAQFAGAGRWAPPDRAALAAGPVLLLLHDTFSTPQATFAEWIGDESFEPVLHAFGGRCLAFTHPTLATGLDET